MRHEAASRKKKKKQVGLAWVSAENGPQIWWPRRAGKQSAAAGCLCAEKSDIVAAEFSMDGLWYRAKIDKINPNTREAEVIYNDYGNREAVEYKNLAPLPSTKFNPCPSGGSCIMQTSVCVLASE